MYANGGKVRQKHSKLRENCTEIFEKIGQFWMVFVGFTLPIRQLKVRLVSRHFLLRAIPNRADNHTDVGDV